MSGKTAENAGLDGSIVWQKVSESTQANFGYNALTNTYEDMVKAGRLRPFTWMAD